ncbi:molybdenum cofactor biosynthesis protein MoaA [Candidatus Bathyarchaeota archaeon]|nr:MAG: molybdenum cofactor biosynthesis protein MoaA [Candidatus Bathyarchaeota archaeon]
MLCKFCWVSDYVMFHPADVGKFYSPEKIVDGLVTLARKRGLNQLRISGGEPTIGKAHLLQVLENLQGEGFSFILETNGILLGCDKDYASRLVKYNFVHVRVSLKGCSESEFALLTGAKPSGFVLQLKSLQNLMDAGVSCHPSVMSSFSSEKNFQKLLKRIKRIDPKLVGEVEIEELILYPHVVKRLKKYGLEYSAAYKSKN